MGRKKKVEVVETETTTTTTTVATVPPLELVNQTEEEIKGGVKGIEVEIVADIFNKRASLMTEKDLEDIEIEITKCQSDMVSSYLKMSTYFNLVRSKKIYSKRKSKDNPAKNEYEDFADWAKKRFDFTESYAHRLANIGEYFVNRLSNNSRFFEYIPDENKYITTGKETKKKDFGRTQLIELLPLRNDNEKLKIVFALIKEGIITTDSKVDEIKEIVSKVRHNRIIINDDNKLEFLDVIPTKKNSKPNYILMMKEFYNDIETLVNGINVDTDLSALINEIKSKLEKVKTKTEN